MQSLQSTVTLNNGVAMPIFGLGVYNSKEETTFRQPSDTDTA